MDEDRITTLITTWIARNKPSVQVPGPEVDLLQAGIVDSLDYLTIVEFVSHELGIEIDIAEFEDSELGTIRGIARQIAKQAG